MRRVEQNHNNFNRKYDQYTSGTRTTDFDDEGLETRSHRMKFTGRDRAGLRSSNPGLQGYGYSESYDDVGQTSTRTGHYGKGPKGYRRSDERIKEDVCEALYVHPEIDATDIEVDVKEGVVILSGMVEDRELKRGVELEIENISGVQDVQNDLKVARGPNGSSTSSFRNSKLA